ncbi:MAG: DUF1287 domain-containing protein [Pyrinomonadaceae bacterium]
MFLLLCLLAAGGCSIPPTASQPTDRGGAHEQRAALPQPTPQVTVRSSGVPFLDRLAEAAVERTNHKVRYDGTYTVIDYPGGDVPAEIGVCTDEVIRSYRKLGIDLQKEVHEDMKRNFGLYPRQWGLSKPDTNIDHRRVPNLMVFFGRKGESLPVSDRAADYGPGDVVTWDLGGGLTHIGIVVGVASAGDPERLMIVHNIGAGPRMEDVLFNWKITGHYRYFGPPAATPTPTPRQRQN